MISNESVRIERNSRESPSLKQFDCSSNTGLPFISVCKGTAAALPPPPWAIEREKARLIGQLPNTSPFKRIGSDIGTKKHFY
jgi:hypothetical protein